jgi:hypothetical protein
VPYFPAPGPYRARILDLHAAALLAVLRAERDTSGAYVPVGTPEVIAQLLGHEQRYWIRSAEVAEMMAGPDAPTIQVLCRIVAAGSLLGAGSEARAVALLRRVPGSPATVKVAAWLHDLYPPDTEGDWLGSLRPDRLAEYFVVHELGESPELAAACLADLDDRQVERALTVLGHAAQEAPAAQDFLARIVPALDRVASDPAVSSDRLERIAGAIPGPRRPFSR